MADNCIDYIRPILQFILHHATRCRSMAIWSFYSSVFSIDTSVQMVSVVSYLGLRINISSDTEYSMLNSYDNRGIAFQQKASDFNRLHRCYIPSFELRFRPSYSRHPKLHWNVDSPALSLWNCLPHHGAPWDNSVALFSTCLLEAPMEQGFGHCISSLLLHSFRLFHSCCYIESELWFNSLANSYLITCGFHRHNSK